MNDIEPPCRRATPDDASALAELVEMAGEGLPAQVWAGMAMPGETIWEVGQRRARREEGAFSYRNAVVVEVDGAVAATLMGYPLPPIPEPIDESTLPPMFVPLQELENLAPHTWYVNVLATYPQHRRQGHGARLLAIADRLAATSGKEGLSIIVSDANAAALRLYEHCGYRRRALRAMVKQGWENPGTAWVLLVKPG
jgi:ribosomal protein S18 acetylase RimI-like enzyme